MSAPKKLRGGSDSQLTQFKKLWLYSLAESARDYWRALFCSDTTQAELRKLIFTKLKINLTRDGQLTEFRSWLDEQDARAAEAQRQAEDEAALKQEFADLTNDQVRQLVIRGTVARAKAQGDWKLGLSAVDRDLKFQQVALDKNKFEFDATRAAMAKLPELKAIASNKALSDDEKLEQARLALFGVAPK